MIFRFQWWFTNYNDILGYVRFNSINCADTRNILMNAFKIYQHPDGSREAVKQGWSWPGFFFGPIWAMVKKMWGLGGGLLVVILVLALVPVDPGIALLTALINFGIYIACGINGNAWRVKNLESRGYEYQETLEAATPEGAIALYLKD